MPRRCAICESPMRAAAEGLRVMGRTVPAIAEELQLPLNGLYRHMRGHVTWPEGFGPQPIEIDKLAPEAVAFDPVDTFRRAFGQEPFGYQVDYLTTTADVVVLKGRQTGFTQAASALAIATARSKPGALAAVISPSLRQSSEVAVRARVGLWELGEKLVQDSVSLLRLRNGSRILSLPGSARGIRGYAVDLLVMDEAAFVDDATWTAARPMVAAAHGRIVVQSTCGAPVGFFHALATEPPAGWQKFTVPSSEAPSIDPEFLAREAAEMSPELYAQEYGCQFGSGLGGRTPLFDPDILDSLFDDDMEEAS